MELETLLLQHGMQYYIAARGAALAQLLPITGNLYHHALEMLLKAGLSRTFPIKDLKDKFRHNLPAIWEAFEAEFPSPELGRFDSTIADVHRWELIRYPEKMLKTGAQITLHWGGAPPQGSSMTPPVYNADATEIDELVVLLFGCLSVNPWAGLYPTFSPDARRFLTERHPKPERMLPPA